MGRKGVSKRKPKKSVSNETINKGSSNKRPGESPSLVQVLVNAKDALLNKVGSKPSRGSNKNRKGR